MIHGQRVRQCSILCSQTLLESLDAFIGDLCVGDLELFETRQSFQVYQPGVGDLCAAEV